MCFLAVKEMVQVLWLFALVIPALSQLCPSIPYHEVCNLSALVGGDYANRTTFSGTSYNGNQIALDDFFFKTWKRDIGILPPWQCGYAFIDWVCSYDFKQCWVQAAQAQAVLPCRNICQKALEECNSHGIQMTIGVTDCSGMPVFDPNVSGTNPSCTDLSYNFPNRYYNSSCTVFSLTQDFGTCQYPGNNDTNATEMWPWNSTNLPQICADITHPIATNLVILGDTGLVNYLSTYVKSKVFLPSENCTRYWAEFFCSLDYAPCSEWSAPRTPKTKLDPCRSTCLDFVAACGEDLVVEGLNCSIYPDTNCNAPDRVPGGNLDKVASNVNTLYYAAKPAQCAPGPTDVCSGAGSVTTPSDMLRVDATGFGTLVSPLQAAGATEDCVQAFVDVLCSASYPSCDASGNILPVCLSTCEAWVSACSNVSYLFAQQPKFEGVLLSSCPLSLFSSGSDCRSFTNNSLGTFWVDPSASENKGRVTEGRDKWTTYIIGAAFIIGVMGIVGGLILLYRWQGSGR